MNTELITLRFWRAIAHTLVLEAARDLVADGLTSRNFRADFSPQPVQRDVPGETEQQYKLEAQYAPLFNQIQNKNTATSLLGDPATNVPGLLDLYTQHVAPEYAAADRAAGTAQREQDIADVGRLGGAAVDAFRAANPQQKALLDSINADTTRELAAGYGLSPAEDRLVKESVRGAQADRGLGYGPSDVYQEALATDAAGTQRHAQRVNQAYQVAGLNQATTADPFQLVVGRASGAGGTNLLNTANANAQGVGNNLFAFGNSLLDFNANAQQAANIAKANNSTALAGAGINAIGSIGSSF